jgi:MFS family permease
VHAHTPALDLGIAKASLALHALSFALIAVSKSSGLFFAASMLGTFGIGYGPVVQSLSLELYVRRGGEVSEAGRLFGAMSVIQALGSQIIGPSLFGIVYIKTVATFPQAMFYVFVAVVLLSLSFLFLIRIPPELNEKTSTDGGVEVEVEAPAAAAVVVSL